MMQKNRTLQRLREKSFVADLGRMLDITYKPVHVHLNIKTQLKVTLDSVA